MWPLTPFPVQADLPCGVEDQQVSVFVDLQGAVCVGAPQGVGGVDGGRSQSFRHGHLHVDTGQVHDNRLREGEGERSQWLNKYLIHRLESMWINRNMKSLISHYSFKMWGWNQMLWIFSCLANKTICKHHFEHYSLFLIFYGLND